MNTESQAGDGNVVDRAAAYVHRLVRFRDANKISNDEFCEHLLLELIPEGPACWKDVIHSLKPEIQSTLQAYCMANLGDDFEPPASFFLPRGVSDEELKAKSDELKRQYADLARLLSDATYSTVRS